MCCVSDVDALWVMDDQRCTDADTADAETRLQAFRAFADVTLHVAADAYGRTLISPSTVVNCALYACLITVIFSFDFGINQPFYRPNLHHS